MITSTLGSTNPESGGGIYGLASDASSALVHLIPVPFEATVSYRAGTAKGPRAIMNASTQVDLLDRDHGHPYRFGIHLHDENQRVIRWNREARKAALPIIKCQGDLKEDKVLEKELALVNDRSERLNAWLDEEVSKLLDQNRIVGVIGGDHSVPFGAIAAHARRFPGMGILHLDAHADLRLAYEGFTWSHASIMNNVMMHLDDVSRLVQVGIRDYCEEEVRVIQSSRSRIQTWYDADLNNRSARGTPWGEIIQEIVDALPHWVYLSFDIDGLDPSMCPHTGTPVPGGLQFQQVTSLLTAVANSGKRIVGFDLVEVAPGPSPDEWDGNVGARLLYKMIGATTRSRMIALKPR